MSEAPPLLTIEELKTAKNRGDKLYWLYSSNLRAGYYWVEERQDCIFLSAVAISPEFKNKKIGRQVLRWVDELVCERGFSRARLAVSLLNSSALYLYLSHGYQVIQCEPDYFGAMSPNKFRLILERECESRPASISTIETVRVSCSDYTHLIQTVAAGYVGISMISRDKSQTDTNFIIFQKQQS